MKAVHLAPFFVVAVLTAPSSEAEQYRTCQLPCAHRVHLYDVVPCAHPCYGPYGPIACHPVGDAIPCMHPVHAWDVIPC